MECDPTLTPPEQDEHWLFPTLPTSDNDGQTEEGAQVCWFDQNLSAFGSEVDTNEGTLESQQRNEGLTSGTWPWIQRGSESQNQDLLCELWKSYEKAKTENAGSPHSIHFQGINVPVYNRPPGFQSDFVQRLESLAQQYAVPSFQMGDAVCMVDKACANSLPAITGDCVAFNGPGDRCLGFTQSGLHTARRGASKVPASSTVKPWRIDVVRTKQEQSLPWYVCLYVPFQHGGSRGARDPHAPTPSSAVLRGAGSGNDARPDPEVAMFLTSFVDLLVNKARAAGRLSLPGEEGVEQEKRFRKSLTVSLQRVAKPFTVRDLDAKWADHVFKDSYGRLSLAQVFEHIDSKGHLPWIRSEREVRESGVDVIGDHVALLEAVENLFLYVKDLHANTPTKSHQPDADSSFWSEEEQKRILRDRRWLRKECWAALHKDDAEGLTRALAEGATRMGVEERELMVLLQRWLWRDEQGKGKAQDPQGLIVAAAGNLRGVPESGAVRCLAMLLRRFATDPHESSPRQLALALRKAQALPLRAEAAALLRSAIAARETHFNLNLNITASSSVPRLPEPAALPAVQATQRKAAKRTGWRAWVEGVWKAWGSGGGKQKEENLLEARRGKQSTAGLDNSTQAGVSTKVHMGLDEPEEQTQEEQEQEEREEREVEGEQQMREETVVAAAEGGTRDVEKEKGNQGVSTDTAGEGEVWVSSLLCEGEATLFGELAQRVSSGALGTAGKLRELSPWWLDNLATELKSALQTECVTVSVKGSVSKGTDTRGSDVDVLIDTHGRAVSRADKEAVVARLRQSASFHPYHVTLKKLAIGCVLPLNGLEVDLVFANTAEYGQLPGNIALRLAGNVAAQQAARMLKVSFHSSTSSAMLAHRMPSFVLELLALEAQEARGRAQQLGDGSMQVFCDALQLLVDRPGLLNQIQDKVFSQQPQGRSKVCGTRLSEAKESASRRHARTLLQVLCASRVFAPQQGFSSLLDLEKWVRNSTGLQIPTALGAVPVWVMGCVDEENEELLHYLHLPSGRPERPLQSVRTLEGCQNLALGQNAAMLFRGGAYARFVCPGEQQSSDTSDTRPSVKNTCWSTGDPLNGAVLSKLSGLAASGSEVAMHMLATRLAWREAEAALDDRDFHKAVTMFGVSLRASVADGDPFSGAIAATPDGSRDLGRYRTAIDAVSRTCVQGSALAIDSKLLRARILLEEGNCRGCERELSECMTADPLDARLPLLRAIPRGNLGDFAGLLQDVERSVKLGGDEAEPICYYWKGVALQHAANESSAGQRAARDAINAFQHFLSIAPPEGRKVCQAWWACAYLEMICMWVGGEPQNKAEWDKGLDSIQTLIESAERAEAQMLPVLMETERTAASSQAKSSVLAARAMRKLSADTGPLALFERMRRAQNDRFQRGDYSSAVSGYSQLIDIIESSPSTSDVRQQLHVVLSNRSCAHEKLGMFTAAETDARAAIAAQPSWLKGHIRLARALLGSRQGGKVAVALREAYAQVSEKDGATLQALGLEAEAEAAAEAEALRPSSQVQRDEPSSFACWAKVMFKGKVVVVDSSGSGDFINLQDALASVETQSSIIVLAGKWPVPALAVQGRTIQIIGEGRVTVSKDRSSTTAFVVSASQSGNVYLDNLVLEAVLPNTSVLLHCVGATTRGTVQATNCVMTSTAAACFSEDDGSKVVLVSCTTQGPGAAALALRRGGVEIRECEISKSSLMAVEVRSQGWASVERSTISDCKKQACCIWSEGGELSVRDSTLTRCGRGGIPSSAALMVGAGTARVTNCSIMGNRGEGVTVQDENNTARLVMHDCKVFANTTGVAFYGGSGEVVNSRVQENAMSALTVLYGTHAPTGVAFRDIALTRNVLHGVVGVTAAGCTKASVLARVRCDNNTGFGRIPVVIYPDQPSLVSATANPFSRTIMTGMTFSIDAVTGSEVRGDLGESFRERLTRKQHTQELPPNLEECAVHFDKPSLVAHHTRMLSISTHRMQAFRCQLPGPTPPNTPTGTDPGSLSECSIHDLAATLGRRATGRVLYGKLCVEPWRSTAVYTILEDAEGSGVKAGLYNVPAAQSSQWQRCFPEGMQIGIKEPFLKRFADATIGIRVDDPCDLVYVTSICSNCHVAETKDTKMLFCNRCRVSRYCSKECQRAAWKGGHSKACKPPLSAP